MVSKSDAKVNLNVGGSEAGDLEEAAELINLWAGSQGSFWPARC